MLRPHPTLLAALAAAACAAAPHAAHAQLLKRIGRAVVEKAADRGGPAASPAGGPAASEAGPAAARPAAGPTRLEITPERITAFISAMKPLVDAGEGQRAAAAAERRRAEYDACAAKATAGPPSALSPAAEAQQERILAAMSANAERTGAVMRDAAASARLADSSAALLDAQRALMYPALRTRCGARPPAPPAAPAGEVTEHGLRPAADKLGPSAPAAAGMSPAQLGLMRERIALYLLAPDRANDLTPGERSALDGQRGALGPFAAAVRSGTLTWRTWNDLWPRDGWSSR